MPGTNAETTNADEFSARDGVNAIEMANTAEIDAINTPPSGINTFPSGTDSLSGRPSTLPGGPNSLLGGINTFSGRPGASLGGTNGTNGVEMISTAKLPSVSDVRPPVKRLSPVEIVLFVLPIIALFLWSISLQTVSLNDINNLGLISALSPRIIFALVIVVISFAVVLQRRELRISLLMLHLVCLIVILYATPNLIEQAPRFAPVYKHSGYTEYIMRTGSVDPNLDIYFDFPGFFVLSAFITKMFGYTTILSFVGWAPVVYNLMYMGPMYIILTTMTTNKRLIWLTLLFFHLTNWVGQDYYSPQGLNFFLYLMILAILLKWFTLPKQQVQLRERAPLVQNVLAWLNAPDPLPPAIGPWQRRALLGCVICLFGLVIFSHPLTPFFVLLTVSLLVIFRRCGPFWLPIVMAVMTVAWIFFMAHPYLSQHVSMILSSIGDLTDNVPASVKTGKVAGDPLYQVVAKMRLYMTLLVWFMGFVGGIKRLRQGQRDITWVLLACAPFPLIAAQSYGGEMLMRIYLFSSPFILFFSASIFCENPVRMPQAQVKSGFGFPWRTAIIIVVNVFLLSTLFFTRYGDERVDYVSYDEFNAIQYVYQHTPPKSTIIEAWDDTPFLYKDFEQYNFVSLYTVLPDGVVQPDINAVIQLVESEHSPNVYIVTSQEEQVHATAWDGLPSDMVQRLYTQLLKSGKFRVVYSNADAQVLQYIG
jgi:hypothetical protein